MGEFKLVWEGEQERMHQKFRFTALVLLMLQEGQMLCWNCIESRGQWLKFGKVKIGAETVWI